MQNYFFFLQIRYPSSILTFLYPVGHRFLVLSLALCRAEPFSINNEYLASLAFEKYGIKNTIFRPFSGYGSDQDLNYPFPSIIKRAVNHNTKNDFIVWGTGNQSRDFIHIKDVVKGSLLISKKVKNGRGINLSSGKFLSFKKLAKIILTILGKKNIKVIGNSNKPEGVFARGGSLLLQRQLGFTPKIGIEEGIKMAIKDFDNLY